jgi:glycine/D-amino acid oxidase-like deaminating enzyme
MNGLQRMDGLQIPDNAPHVPPQIGTVVIGGGIVGLCLARILAREGCDVAVVDSGRDAGSSANAGSLHVQMQSRFIRMYPDQVPALERALPLYVAAGGIWRELAAELAAERGADIEFKESGGLMIAETPEQYAFLEKKCAREKSLGLDVAMIDRAELRRVAPYLGDAAYGAEFCAHEGKLNPLLANAAIMASAQDAGAVVLTDTQVTGLALEGGGYRIETCRGAMRAGRIILSAGAGTGALAERLGVSVPTTGEPLHMNITEAAQPIIGHLVQHAERMITLKQLASGHVVIGGGWPARSSPGGGIATVERESVLGNLSLALHMVPALRALRIIRTWAGINTTTDGQCVIGAAGPPGLFIAVPGDAGYTLGPLVARLAAAQVLGREPEFDTAPFTPARFTGKSPSLLSARA